MAAIAEQDRDGISFQIVDAHNAHTMIDGLLRHLAQYIMPVRTGLTPVNPDLGFTSAGADAHRLLRLVSLSHGCEDMLLELLTINIGKAFAFCAIPCTVAAAKGCYDRDSG